LYHASKWGIEGFFESVIAEVAPFDIGVTIVEPGGARTNFGRSLSIAPALNAYALGPVGQVRQFVEAPQGVTENAPGDPGKIAEAIIASVDVSPAPRRLALGSDAYQAMHAALASRLAELEAGRTLALSTDVTS
jgi:NAD(P)-dependent dehydrogenase (short-subunit alcohol dehydrogenase family)